MVKRLLAFVLTAALIVETPATAYAVEQTPITAEDSVQDLVGGGDKTDTSSQDGTEDGDSISEETADDSSVENEIEVSASVETENTEGEDGSEDIESDAASESGNDAALEAEEPLGDITESVKLVPSGDGVSAAAYSFKDTFTVELGDDAAAGAVLADSYQLEMILNGFKLTYAPDGEEVQENLVLDKAASYEKELCSSDFFYGDMSVRVQLRPDTEYELEYVLSWEIAEGNELSATGTINFKTAKANMSWNVDRKAIVDNKMPVEVHIDNNDAATNTADLKGMNIGLCAYLKENKEDATYSKLSDDVILFDSVNNYTQTFNVDIADLDPETEYVLALGLDGDTSVGEAAVLVYDTYRFYPAVVDEDNSEIKIGTTYAAKTAAVITYQLSGLDAAEKRDLILYYKADAAESWTTKEIANAVNTEVGSFDSVKLTGLTAGTAYSYALLVADDNTTEPAQADIKTFNTLSADATVNNITFDASDTSVDISYSPSSNAVGASAYILFYYRKSLAGENSEEWTRVELDKDASVKTISGLTAETTYEYKIGFASDVNASVDEADVLTLSDTTFTTKKPAEDNREIKGITVESKPTRVKINYTLSGNLSDKDYVVCFYKAKNANEQDWIMGDWWPVDGYDLLEINSLSPKTEYEYKIGFCSRNPRYNEISAAELVKPVRGDFSTIADNRKVTATVESKATTATISYTLSGDYDNLDTIYCFYKVKDAGTWTLYDYRDAVGEGDEFESDDSFVLEGLNPETTYEYKVGFGPEDISTPDKLEGECAEADFKTLADQRKLSNAQAEVVESGSSPKIMLNAFFSGNIEEKYTYIYYFYKEQAAAGTDAASAPTWNKYSTSTSSVKRYCIQSITDGIDWGKTYDYAIVISDNSSLNNPDEVTKEGWKLTGNVVVPATKAPTSITLSQSDLYLNLTSDGEGCDYQIIKADIAPADANKALVCSSSNPDVVDAYYSNGRILVYATGIGKAAITIKSPYSDTVSATINVEVASYIILARDGATVSPEPMTYVAYPKFTDGKNIVSKEEYLLYKVTDMATGAATLVTDYKVTSENESIVTWREKERKLVTGKSVGTADLVFTDGEGKFKARLTVETYSSAKTFAITGLTNSTYDAIEKDGVYTIPNSYASYKAVVKFSPSSSLSTSDLSMFGWSSSNTAVATVNDGIITPVGAGETTITATTDITDFNKQVLAPATIKIKVVELPGNLATSPVYVLANTVTKLSDVTCPDGWAWKEPETPIVTNAVNTSPYQFEAVYTKGDKYPAESTVSVYIARVTGISAYSDPDAVLEVAKSSTDAENDSLTLTVNTGYQGGFNSLTKANGYEDYHIEIPDVTGLKIEPIKYQSPYYDENGLNRNGIQQFTIKAQKAGSYTLKPAIYVKDAKGNKKLLAKTSYKLKAVDASLAESIGIQLTEEAKKNTSIKTDVNGRLYIDLTPSNEIGAAAAESVQDFDVEAILKDWKDALKIGDAATTATSETLKNTKVTWKVSDVKVATVKADSANSQKAKVTVKGEGHTILTATAKDAAGHSAQLNIEIRNHAPRVSASNVNVNTALDYTSEYGLLLAENEAGLVEIVPVYGEYIRDVKLYEDDTLSNNFKVYGEYEDCVIGAKSAELRAGKYIVEMRVTTSTNKTYKYPIKVTVKNKPAKVTAKSVNAVNLFYTNDEAAAAFKISGANDGISSVKWTDNSTGVGNGFSTEWYCEDEYGYGYWYGGQENISLTNKNKPSDAGIVKGEFTVKLYGYRDACTVPMTIKWNYKKPSIVTYKNNKAAASTTIEPAAGVYSNYFQLYDKTNKRYVYYGDSSYGEESQRYYHAIICNNKNIEIEPYDIGYNRVNYHYTASKTSGSEKIEFKLASNVWREDLTVKHTIKLAKPTAVLSASQIVINTNKPAVNSTQIYLKNSGYVIALSDVKVEGKDAKSTKLLDDDLLEIINNNGTDDSEWIDVRQNDAKIMGKDPIKAGTYSYKLTPYYTDNSGNRQALNTVILKVKVINKDITVKTKVKNTLDLVKGTASYNYMEITPTFSNIGTGYSVKGVKLTGEYSKYFTLSGSSNSGYRNLMISGTGVGKLKAGQSYKLTLEYTVSMTGGDVFTVTSKPITVKPKQTAPKVKVTYNNQTIYAGADDVGRYYMLETDAYKYKVNGETKIVYPYEIVDVDGSLDCNKDGVADIIVSSSWSSSYYCSALVEIADRDGVLTATGTKGKTYSVPVTVTLRGRDGISKDVKTTIKVTIKR